MEIRSENDSVTKALRGYTGPVLTTRAWDLCAKEIGPRELGNRAADAEAGLVSV